MPVKLFFCYAHEDEPLLDKLKSHLSPLRRQGLIEMWHDRDISAGTEWEQEINEHLNTAQIILLLISPDFMDSDYCYGIEMQRAIERHNRGEAVVIPIILRPVYWQGKPLGTLQALPKDAKPVTDPDWHNLDRALFNVTEGIRKAIENIASRPSTPLSVPPVPPSLRQATYPPQNYPDNQTLVADNQPPLKQQQLVSENQVSISLTEKPINPGLKPYLLSLLIGVAASIPGFVLYWIFDSVPVWIHSSVPVSDLFIVFVYITPLLCSLIGGYIAGKIVLKRRMGLLVGTEVGVLFSGQVLLAIRIVAATSLGVVYVVFCGLLGLLGAWFATRKQLYYVKPRNLNHGS